MAEKVILVLVDGMRPDGLLQCGHPFVDTLRKNATVYLQAQTVNPSVTLPCHMSLFHSVDPERHGITTNTYIPQVRPLEGLVDRLDNHGRQIVAKAVIALVGHTDVHIVFLYDAGNLIGTRRF